MDKIEKNIRAALDAFWEEMALQTESDGAITVDALVGPIESMTAVEVLVIIDAIVGAQVPNCVIQPGGYKSKDEFIEKLTKRVLDWWNKAKS